MNAANLRKRNLITALCINQNKNFSPSEIICAHFKGNEIDEMQHTTNLFERKMEWEKRKKKTTTTERHLELDE